MSLSDTRDIVVESVDLVIGLLRARKSPSATRAQGEAEPPSSFKNWSAGSGKCRPLAEKSAPKKGEIRSGFFTSDSAVLPIICKGDPVRCLDISMRIIAKAKVTQTVMIVAIVVIVSETLPNASNVNGKPI